MTKGTELFRIVGTHDKEVFTMEFPIGTTGSSIDEEKIVD